MANIPPSYSSFYRFLCKKQPDSCQILYEFMKLSGGKGPGGGGEGRNTCFLIAMISVTPVL